MERRYDPISTNHELVLMGGVPDDEDDLEVGRDEQFGNTHEARIDLDDDNERVEPAADEEPGGAATASTTISTGRKRKCTSDVWDDMDKIFAIKNGVEVRIGARCHFCKKEVTAWSTGGTGHLSRHVAKCKRQHGRTGHQSMLRYNPDGSVCSWEYSPEEARVQLCRLIARLDLPLNFSESAAFEDYIKIAHNPRYFTISRQTTTRDVEKHFKDKHAKLVERLQSVSCVALTSHIWSGNAKEDYLSVVAHFVNEKRILAMRLIDCSHSGVNIAERIADVVAEYGLTDKIFSITLDNASANSKAMETLSSLLSGYVGPLLLHQRCTCHIINLIVKSAFEELKHFLDDFRTPILFLNSSNQRIAAYKSFYVALGVRPRKFSLYMDVRWNSTYLMLKHLIPYKSNFSTHYPPRPQGPLLTDDHWHVGEKILEFFERFYDSTVVMSGVYYPTSPLMLHHILCIIRHLNLYENDRLLRTTIVPMKDKFFKYWGAIPMLYAFAFILDTRAKIRGFNNVLCLLSRLTGRDYSAYLTTLRAELSDLFKKYDDKFGAVRLQRPSNAAPGEGPSNPSALSRRTSSSALLHAASTPTGISGTELASYLDSDTVQKFDNDFNILDYWYDHKITYPVLSILAKDVLSVPVSIVSSESAFSLVSRVIEERRRRLLPSMVEMLSLIKDWEAGDARMQHTAEDKALEESFEQLFLDDLA
ncbi:hypothetical protein U9M48_007598 [Paspalum notatum var. saurae]|uniref:Transposase n=1 Tax=Paspalum notatum var. saurae TaxID=547442 RepID=A0AAQ3SMK5_PASNO